MTTWNITTLDVKPTEGDLTDVVVTAHWTLSQTDGDYSASVYGTVSFTAPEGNFTPYADLTLDQVVGWVKNSMGEETVAAHELNVANQIAAQKNPPVITPALPWAV
jgi:hypothetical protein